MGSTCWDETRQDKLGLPGCGSAGDADEEEQEGDGVSKARLRFGTHSLTWLIDRGRQVLTRAVCEARDTRQLRHLWT